MNPNPAPIPTDDEDFLVSQCNLNTTMTRIASAPEESPIAVYRTEERLVFSAVFADTVHTRRDIAVGNVDLIGVYHGGMPRDVVRNALLGWQQTSQEALSA